MSQDVVTPQADPQPIVSRFKLTLKQVDGFEFKVHFDKGQWADLTMDEPPPLGHDGGPNPARILAASIGNCLAASLLFCLQKAKVQVIAFDAEVAAQLVRNERRRLRVGSIRVILRPHVSDEGAGFTRCLSEFEDFCVVTQSVREGIDIQVDVQPVTDTTMPGPTG